MASGKGFDRRQPISWGAATSRLSITCAWYSTCARSLTTHITDKGEASQVRDTDHGARQPLSNSQRRQYVKLYPSVKGGWAAMDCSSESAAHCDLHLPTRLPKALRQATPETDRRDHTPAQAGWPPKPEQKPVRRLLTGRGVECLQTIQSSGLSRLANAASSGVLPKPLVGLQTRICAFRHIDSTVFPRFVLLC